MLETTAMCGKHGAESKSKQTSRMVEDASAAHQRSTLTTLNKSAIRANLIESEGIIREFRTT